MPTTQSPNKRFDTSRYIEGFATTFDTPYVLWEDNDGTKYFEVVDRHALDQADMSDVIMQYNHQGKVLARISNQTLLVEPQDKGLFIAADLSKSRAAEDMHQEIENQLVTKMSWGFRLSEYSYDRVTRTFKIIKVSKVFDISAVSIPANAGTEISARSWIDGVIDAEKRESLALRARCLQLLIKTNGGEKDA